MGHAALVGAVVAGVLVSGLPANSAAGVRSAVRSQGSGATATQPPLPGGVRSGASGGSSGRVQAASSDWLDRLNAIRGAAGLPPVVEDASLSHGDVLHALWMQANQVLMHGETPGTPLYTPEGDLAGQTSNLAACYGCTDAQMINIWAGAPFHAIGMLDPALGTTGYGAAGTAPKWAALNVISGRGPVPPSVQFPVSSPAWGATTDLTINGGAEVPDPASSCPGYNPNVSPGPFAGAPLTVQFVSPGAVSSASLVRIGVGPQTICVFDGNTYSNPDPNAQALGRAVLGARNAVVVLPLQRLFVGSRYTLTVTAAGVTSTSTFTVGNVMSPPTNPMGNLDGAILTGSNLEVSGWALDPNDRSTPTAVHVTVDGTVTNIGAANLPSPDVEAAWPGAGVNHRFDATLTGIGPGRHTVCAIGVNVGVGSDTQLGDCIVATRPATFTPLPPARILDTRFNLGLTGPFGPQATRDLTVVGVGGVPASHVSAVILNVTAVGASAGGWLTLFPTGQSLPTASNLNFSAGQTIANLVVVKVGYGGASEGKVSINNTGANPAAGSVNLVADVVGYYGDDTTPPADSFTSVSPNRIVDTRSNTGLTGAFAPQQTRNLQVGGQAGVPVDADAVVMNVTATGPSAGGWLTLFPAGQSLPTASNLNFAAGQSVANLVTVKLGTGGANAGKVSITNTGGIPSGGGTVDVVGDVVGYYKAGVGTLLTPIAPQRILDTRFGTGGVSGPVAPQGTITVDPETATGLPPVGSYSAVIVNVTATAPSAGGWLTVFPSDQSLPTASNLNFVAGETVPNLVKIRVGADGKFKINNTGGNPAAGSVQIIADIVGYYQ
jgi:uncharacterized protein YkwD